jgi:hypothetical protein
MNVIDINNLSPSNFFSFLKSIENNNISNETFKLFNYEKDLGYNEENFDVLFKTKLLELAKLVKFINTESDGD